MLQAIQNTSIRDVTLGIRDIIFNEMSDLLVAEDNISLDSPGDINIGTGNNLSFFLYHVGINQDLRNQEPSPAILEEGGESSTEWRGRPVALNLDYIITPYSQHRDTEMEIYERLIQTFDAEPVLTTTTGDSRMIHCDFTLEEIYRIWSIFPEKSYKLPFFLKVSPVFVSSTRVKVLPQVEEVKKTIKRN